MIGALAALSGAGQARERRASGTRAAAAHERCPSGALSALERRLTGFVWGALARRERRSYPARDARGPHSCRDGRGGKACGVVFGARLAESGLRAAASHTAPVCNSSLVSASRPEAVLAW